MADAPRRVAQLDTRERRELLGRLIDRRGRRSKERLARRVAPGERVPASMAQQRLWFLDQLAPGNPFYNVPFALRIRGDLDVDALRRAVTEIVTRHDALRTTFVGEGGVPYQVVSPPGEIEFPVTDLTSLPESERDDAAMRAACEDAARPFDLARGPLFRAGLIRISERDHVLTTTTHHIVIDGTSIEVMARELSALYGAFSTGRPSPLPELEVQYPDFSEWQRENTSGDELEKHLDYWREKLAGLSVLDMPTDRPRPREQTFRGAVAMRVVPRDVLDALKAYANRAGGSLFIGLLAAFDALLHRYTGQDDVVLGSMTAGRVRREIEPLIGFFVNTIVVRTDVGGNPTYAELVERVKRDIFDARTHDAVPFERLVDELDAERDKSRNPLFQISFTGQNSALFGGGFVLGDAEVSQFPVDPGVSRFDLSVQVGERADGLVVWIDYSTDLFDADRIERMLAHYENVLRAVAADPDVRVGDIELLTDAERDAAI
ncbi:MAG TPA: condensation domain-containing protein, partial [Actinomycetota bacterium]|nr:condensation domain-containing protein [Actinomycetota bacterium]